MTARRVSEALVSPAGTETQRLCDGACTRVVLFVPVSFVRNVSAAGWHEQRGPRVPQPQAAQRVSRALTGPPGSLGGGEGHGCPSCRWGPGRGQGGGRGSSGRPGGGGLLSPKRPFPRTSEVPESDEERTVPAPHSSSEPRGATDTTVHTPSWGSDPLLRDGPKPRGHLSHLCRPDPSGSMPSQHGPGWRGPCRRAGAQLAPRNL